MTSAQAQRDGISRTKLSRLVRTGRLENPQPRLYRIAGSPDGWFERAHAATLAANAAADAKCPGAIVFVLAGLAAAHLHGIVDESADIELSGLRNRRAGVNGVRVRTTTSLPEGHRTHRRGIPALTIPRTIVDIAGAVPDRDLRLILIDAWRRGLVTPSEVARCADELGRFEGATSLRAALAGCYPQLARARSIEEIRAFLLIADAGLLLPTVNLRITTPYGVREIDLAYEGLLHGFEIDSRQFHTVAPDAAQDDAKEEELAEVDWTVERVPVSEVRRDPGCFIARVRAAIEGRGHRDVA